MVALKTEISRQERLLEEQYGKESKSVSPEPSSLRKRMKPFYSSRIDVALQMLRGGKSLLDVGCGQGEFAIRAASQYEEIYGMDLISYQIELARGNAQQSGLKSAKFIVFNLDHDRWPYPDDTFDTIACIAVLPHVLDPYHTVRESWRLLRPNGQFIIQIPNIAYVRRRLQLLFGQLPNTSYQLGWDGGTLRYFTVSSVKKLLGNNGFQVGQIKGSGMVSSLRSWWPSLLCPDIIVDARATKTQKKWGL